ncbi:glutaredoxin family protein [Propioniciclava tarda]|uniref:glutaredoxin family protein n=1 Tax=Propioniciclava tarda TaxID=433330 RepID=UPI00116B099A|nr:glutaredoxin family protein [Propioniciclava tarda]SMO36949.1 Glutaredoxin-like domain [Propioniciclava tarda]HOA88915.1 glutaredoxin family protein [Propioniciclava tarda]HQA31229.1 glutaredoxin family protein [Propioniciclava tarda]HQD60846.1 glutaredoxin family protein [Propioniciclava tarda]
MPAVIGDGTARVVVLVRTGCHLCDDAQRIIATVCQDTGDSWQAVDVDSDPELRSAYTDHVPVTFVDGVQLSLWFVEADALRAALT